VQKWARYSKVGQCTKWDSPIIATQKYHIFVIFANHQLSCFTECRQSVYYKVILGLIFGSAWTKTTFDRMRKTRHVSCEVLAWLDTGLDISSWKLVCMDRKRLFGFRKMSSIFQVRGICCDLLEYLFYSKLWKQNFSPLHI